MGSSTLDIYQQPSSQVQSETLAKSGLLDTDILNKELASKAEDHECSLKHLERTKQYYSLPLQRSFSSTEVPRKHRSSLLKKCASSADLQKIQ